MTILRFMKRTILWIFIIWAILNRFAVSLEEKEKPETQNKPEYYLYYSYLNPDEKVLYEEIYEHARTFTAEFEPSVSVSIKDVPNAFEAVFNDHPELFWLDTTYTYKYNDDENCVCIMLKFYEMDADINEEKAAFEAATDAIIKEAAGLQSDFAKELFVHNRLLSETVYDETATMHQSAYSVLVNKKSVCAGYARAFQYLMNRLEIPTYYCMSITEGHAWNIVQLDDGYYNVDLTWDDEATSSYMYFNCTDEELKETHIRTGKSILLPECKGKKYGLEER